MRRGMTTEGEGTTSVKQKDKKGGPIRSEQRTH